MERQTPSRSIMSDRLVRAAQVCGIFVVLFAGAAALHPPRYADGSQQSRDATLAECLRYLRAQIFVYTLEHNGVAPGYPGNDITRAPEPDLTRPIADRKVGGLGIHMVRQLAETIRYEYKDRVSTTTITKKVSANA